MTTLSDGMKSFRMLQEKYGVRGPDGHIGLSLAKMYSDGVMEKLTPVQVRSPTGEIVTPKPKVVEDRSKLNGTLSLSDLNGHRAANGLKTALSHIDFEALLKKTEGSFQNFETDATMNYRRNRYLWDMSETVTPEASVSKAPSSS